MWLHGPPETSKVLQPLLAEMVDMVDKQLFFTKFFHSQHHSFTDGAQITRVASAFVTDPTTLAHIHIQSRRVWLGIADPASPYRTLDNDAVEALNAWREVLTSSSFCMSMRQPISLPVQATADAMAS